VKNNSTLEKLSFPSYKSSIFFLSNLLRFKAPLAKDNHHVSKPHTEDRPPETGTSSNYGLKQGGNKIRIHLVCTNQYLSLKKPGKVQRAHCV
jgi:hypothetical protein